MAWMKVNEKAFLDEFTAALRFERAGSLVVRAPVRSR